MAIGTIPPWLNVQPSQFVEAARSGTAAGVSIAAAQQRAQEAAAENARAAAAADARRWEFEQELQRRAQEQLAARQQAAAQLAASERYNLARLAQDRTSNEAQIAHWQAMEDAANARAGAGVLPTEFARDPNKEYITRGGAYIPKVKPGPTEVQTITEKLPEITAAEATPAIPATPYQKRSLFGIDWLAKDIPASPGSPAVVPRPAQTITRRVPISATPTVDTFGTPYPPAPQQQPSPFKEGALLRNKKDGKLYKVVNGVPELVEE